MWQQLTQQPPNLPEAGTGQQGLLQDDKQGIHHLPGSLCILLALPQLLSATILCLLNCVWVQTWVVGATIGCGHGTLSRAVALVLQVMVLEAVGVWLWRLDSSL